MGPAQTAWGMYTLAAIGHNGAILSLILLVY